MRECLVEGDSAMQERHGLRRAPPDASTSSIPVVCRWACATLATEGERARDRHSATVSPWRWATFHSPASRRYTCVARKV
jgi:hypothetical protein